MATAAAEPQSEPSPLATEAELAEARGELSARPDVVEALVRHEGWSAAAMSALGVGWREGRVIFAARLATGELASVRRYRSGGTPEWLIDLDGVPELWPAIERLPDGPVWLVREETDVVRLASVGIAAVSLQGGEWKSEWVARFAGRDVVVGADFPERIAADLSAHATVRAPAASSADVAQWAADAVCDGSRAVVESFQRLLDNLVEQAPLVTAQRATANGESESLPEAEPSESEASVLLRKVEKFIRTYIVIEDEQALAIALWVLHTHAFEAAYATPYLLVVSAEKGSGKTRLIEVLVLLARTPLHMTGASEAALFRSINHLRPTLFLDEVDAIFQQTTQQTEPIRQVLNAGNREGAHVLRCVGEGKEIRVQTFRVYCAKLLAGIATSLPDTITDRSIHIAMKRKLGDETVEKFYRRDVEPKAQPLHEEITHWAEDAIGTLKPARPDIPDGLTDRAGEAWEPLLAIADLAGGDWPTKARSAAVALSGRAEGTETASRGTLLLGAIRRAFGQAIAMSTGEILDAVNNDPELPFGAWNDGDGLRAHGLAKELARYGIKSRTVRTGDTTHKGYRRDDFEEPWARYLPRPRPEPSQASHSSHGPEPSRRNAHTHGDVTDVTVSVERGARVTDPPCRYLDHRRSDWRQEGGRWRCGVCSPPADESLVAERRRAA